MRYGKFTRSKVNEIAKNKMVQQITSFADARANVLLEDASGKQASEILDAQLDSIIKEQISDCSQECSPNLIIRRTNGIGETGRQVLLKVLTAVKAEILLKTKEHIRLAMESRKKQFDEAGVIERVKQQIRKQSSDDATRRTNAFYRETFLESAESLIALDVNRIVQSVVDTCSPSCFLSEVISQKTGRGRTGREVIMASVKLSRPSIDQLVHNIVTTRRLQAKQEMDQSIRTITEGIVEQDIPKLCSSLATIVTWYGVSEDFGYCDSYKGRSKKENLRQALVARSDGVVDEAMNARKLSGVFRIVSQKYPFQTTKLADTLQLTSTHFDACVRNIKSEVAKCTEKAMDQRHNDVMFQNSRNQYLETQEGREKRKYGCAKNKRCWHHCDALGWPREWCESTKSFSQSYRFIDCDCDYDCTESRKAGSNCGGPCTIFGNPH